MKPGRPVGETRPARSVRVWDPLVRIFHWALVLAFFGAWILGDGGTLHQALGYSVLGLVVFRLVWGVVGSRHARFANFVPTPRRLLAYARDLVARREARHLGHNPAGAVMIIAMLLVLVATGVTGWLQTTDAFWGSEVLDTLHKTLANGMLGLVGLHVAGVVYSSLRHRENLVRAMFTGRKRVDPRIDPINRCVPRERQAPRRVPELATADEPPR
ncbi:MAG TPA: cytochrome b/b6 domain-containing protein [Rhodanobacteraceae bacterium]|nr:cytochrome b/b6 domain-containing protein [Rhodanobacteraceae bacterium]